MSTALSVDVHCIPFSITVNLSPFAAFTAAHWSAVRSAFVSWRTAPASSDLPVISNLLMLITEMLSVTVIVFPSSDFSTLPSVTAPVFVTVPFSSIVKLNSDTTV